MLTGVDFISDLRPILQVPRLCTQSSVLQPKIWACSSETADEERRMSFTDIPWSLVENSGSKWNFKNVWILGEGKTGTPGQKSIKARTRNNN